MRIIAILFAFIASTAAAQSDLDIALALAKAKAKAKHVSTPAIPHINPALTKPKAAYKTIPAQGYYETRKVCYGTHCEYKKFWVQTSPARRVLDEGASTLPADQQPTPMAGIGSALRALNPRGKVFLDIGCGFDCRAGIVAVRDFGAARVIAVEIDPAVAESARRYVAHAGLSHKIDVITADAADVDFPAGAVGFAYLFPDTLEQLAPKIKTLDRFASFAHKVPGLPMRESGDVFVYEKPQPVASSPAGAVWGGRVYSGPVCNRRNCSMCNAIRAQLAWN